MPPVKPRDRITLGGQPWKVAKPCAHDAAKGQFSLHCLDCDEQDVKGGHGGHTLVKYCARCGTVQPFTRVCVVYQPRRRWPKFRWVHEALSRTPNVEVVHARTLAEVRDADATCDVLLFEHKCPVEENALADMAPTRKAFWCQWWFDLLAQRPDIPLDQQPTLMACPDEPTPWLKTMRLMNLCLVKERSMLAEFGELGVTAEWMDQACPSNMPACEHRENPEFDVLVVGSGGPMWKQRRDDVAALLGGGCRVLWCGHPSGTSPPLGCHPESWVDPLELPKQMSRCAVALSVDCRSDLDGYWSDRLWLLLGMGACVLHRRGGSAVRHTPAYNSHHELVEQMRVLVHNGADFCRAFGATQRQAVMSAHTYEHRVKEVLELCAARMVVPA